MSTAPRPLPWKVDEIQITDAAGGQVLAQVSPVTAYAERAINAFEALLVIAKAAARVRSEEDRRDQPGADEMISPLCQHTDHEWTNEADCSQEDMARSIDALDAALPNWRGLVIASSERPGYASSDYPPDKRGPSARDL